MIISRCSKRGGIGNLKTSKNRQKADPKTAISGTSKEEIGRKKNANFPEAP
jgi:hypothetical protein